MKKLNRSKSGFAQGVILAVITVVILGIIIPIGAVIIGNVQASIDTSSTSALPLSAQSAINTTFTDLWTNWGLLTIVITVVIASVIIGTLLAFGGGVG